MARTSSCADGKTFTLVDVAMPAINPGKKIAHMPMNSLQSDDLLREVYGILGVPVDVTDMAAVLQKIYAAAASRTVLFMSTVNLNYVVTGLTDPPFRESVLLSDLCPADGMPVVWVARLLGVPIKDRIAGSDIFDALRSAQRPVPLKVFLFGSGQGVAAAACEKINAEHSGLVCVGSCYPGFGSVEDMSTDAIIDLINSSNADFLAVALGSKKGQAWLLKNYARLQIPVRAHLGATIGFQAGTVKRAPRWMQKSGIEWFWRILEEPQLWRRYANDGLVLVRLLLTRVLPLVAFGSWYSFKFRREKNIFRVERTEDGNFVTLCPQGLAEAKHINVAISSFRAAVTANKPIVINFAATQLIDSRFLGLVFMLDKQLKGRGFKLTFTKIPSHIRRLFRLNGFEFLLGGVEKA